MLKYNILTPVVERMWRLYKTGIKLTAGSIGLQVSYTLTTESLAITTDSHNSC
jgi:hypothetical protein